jgi:hypothetical protein
MLAQMPEIPQNTVEAAVYYVSRGWGVVPISPETKIPVLKSWTTSPYTDPVATRDRFSRENFNIGIVAGFSKLVCVDSDGESGLAAFLGLVDTNGGEIGDPFVAATPSGGKHFVYAHPGAYVPSRSRRHGTQIDVKGDGGQFLVEPSKQSRYRWEQITNGFPGAMPAWLLEWVLKEEKPREKPTVRTAVHVPFIGDPFGAFLSRLDNVRQRGENHWMACCPAHNSVGRNSLSVMRGTDHPIVAHCFAGCDAEDVFRAVGMEIHQACAPREIEPVAILPGLENINRHEDEDEDPLPDVLCDGLIRDVYEWNKRTSRGWQPELALSGAIALMATLAGRKVEDDQNTRTNVYMIGVAPAGAGKDHARKLNRVALVESGAEDYLTPSDIASGAGLATLLNDYPCRLAQLDEFGDLLSAIRAAGPKARHLSSIETYLKEIYSSSDSTWVTGGYADASKNKTIRFPHLVIYGTGSPDKFWESITPSNIGDGVLPRLMIFMGEYTPHRDGERVAGCPQGIREAVGAWHRWTPGGGNLAGEFTRPFVVPTDSKAAQRLKAHQRDIADKRVTEDHTRAAVWSRTAEKSCKLALIFACSRVRDPAEGGLMVTLDDANKAVALSNWLTRRMIAQVWGKVGKNDRERHMKKLLEILKEPMTGTELSKKTRWMPKKERNELLTDLVEFGEVTVTQMDGSGGPGRTKTVYQRIGGKKTER